MQQAKDGGLANGDTFLSICTEGNNECNIHCILANY